MGVTELTLDVGAVKFSHKRIYDSLRKVQTSGKNGTGWANDIPPRLLLRQGKYFRVEFGEGDAVHFGLEPDTGGVYTATDMYPETMRFDLSDQTFVVTRADRTEWRFPDVRDNEVITGNAKSAKSVSGHVTEFIYNEFNDIARIRAYHQLERNRILGELEYSYLPSGKIECVTLRLFDDGTQQLVGVERAVYAYYGFGEDYGYADNLKTATKSVRSDLDWIDQGTYYYRYYQSGEETGYVNALKQAFFPQEFDDMSKTLGTGACFTADFQTLSGFATKYYEYDSEKRVVREIVNRNTKTITFEYTAYTASDDLNKVAAKTVESISTGETNVVLTNKSGNVILKDKQHLHDDQVESSVHYMRYNVHGKEIERYHPDAVSGYRLEGANLIVDIKDDEGMIELNEYDENASNNSKHNLRRSSIKCGRNGTKIVLREWDYEIRQIGSVIKWYPIAARQMIDEAGTRIATTRFEYEYYPNSVQIKKRTTILPAVPVEENGDGLEAYRTEIFDIDGRTIWERDELGIITYQQFDLVRGVLLKTIQDVDVAKTADFDDQPPLEWQTVQGAGKHLITEYRYDLKLRLVETLAPVNEAIEESTNSMIQSRALQWTVYDDAHNTVMTAKGYAKLGSNEEIVAVKLVNPVSITKRDMFGHVTDQIQASRQSFDGPLAATDVFPQSSYVAWTRKIYENGNLVAKREYFEITTNGDGDKNVHYAETTYAFDLLNRLVRTVEPMGKITKFIYDHRGNVIQQWIGTDDGENGDMVLLIESVYGHTGSCATCAGRGDQLLVRLQHVDSQNSRATEYVYDWRGRQIQVHGEPDAQGRLVYTSQEYDNLDRIVKTEQYFVQEPTDRLLARTQRHFDVRGRVWKSEPSVVNPTNGQVQGTMFSLSWFDERGRQIKAKNSSEKVFACMEYDSLGRNIAQRAKLGDLTFQMRETVYDNIGNAVLLIDSEKKCDSNDLLSRYSGAWFDASGRQLATADYGICDTPPALADIPQSSDDVHVTKTTYDPTTGRAIGSVDPAERVSLVEFDARGRTLRTIANYVENGTGHDQNVTVEYSYAPGGQLVTLTAKNSVTGDQVTTYEYDDLGHLVKEIYPDSENSLDDCVRFEYNRAGERTAKTDQNGSRHEYAYDAFSRVLTDTVTVLGAGVDDFVQKIATEYNVVGNVETITSYSGNGNVVNQIMYTYDDNGQLEREYTAHEGAVDSLVTPFIDYEYSSIEDGMRLTTQIYPSGKRVAYEYDDFGRVVTVLDDENVLVEYEYSGGGSVIRTKYVEPNLTLDYTACGALDRFGRITDHAWKNGSGEDVVRIRHDYDRSGNRLSRKDTVNPTWLETYTYDEMNQIATMNRTGHTESWQYDPTGNWMSCTKNNVVENRNHNAANEILTGVIHEANGNMIVMPKPNGIGNFDCKYDAWNRMVEVVGVAQYEYDGRNHRIRKTVENTVTESFFNHRWQELELTTGDETKSYVWGLRYIDDLICREKGSKKLYSIADPNWNVVALTNAQGIVQERYAYDAFGNLTVLLPTSQPRGSSAFAWNRTFTGQVFDCETGVMLYRNRFYHYGLGRFITRDPIGYLAKDYNLMRYVMNKSVNKQDPYGLMFDPIDDPGIPTNIPMCDIAPQLCAPPAPAPVPPPAPAPPPAGPSWAHTLCCAAAAAGAGGACLCVTVICAKATVITIGGMAIPCGKAIVGCAIGAPALAIIICDQFCPA